MSFVICSYIYALIFIYVLKKRSGIGWKHASVVYGSIDLLGKSLGTF